MNTEVVDATFYITYVFLLTTGTITFTESLRTPNNVVRHIMNLETCISIITAYFYSILVNKISESRKQGKNIPYNEITMIRYTDWMISTPFMLFVLCMLLANEKKKPFTIKIFIFVLFLDLCMILSGYLGETNKISRFSALFLGFMFLIIMFGFIWYIYMSNGKNNFIVSFTYYTFVVIWSIYGIAYLQDEETKNIIYNILDLIAKAFMGIFFWMIFTKSISFS